ncbi:MAG: regulator of protease activity HflC (stomatin/prohibitin superfamily) [Pseudoalteromonas tetraodonis]|jgi:regulator of protease activity HflC (stomatin/prohibitin superfamily)
MITTIPQNHCRIIERFGKPIKIQHSGLAFKLPVIDKVRDVSDVWGGETNKEGRFIELSEQITDTNPRECITKDNAKITVDCVISWRVINPIKAVYEVDHLHQSLLQATLNVIRSEIGMRDLDEALATRAGLNETIVAGLVDTVKKWGIQILRVEIQELRTDDQTSKAMLQQLEAERRSRALSSEAVGQAEATIKAATADRESAVQRAEGQAKALGIVAAAERAYLDTLSEAVGAEEAARILIAQKVIDGFDRISRNPADKVFLPSSMSGILELSSKSKAGGSSTTSAN